MKHNTHGLDSFTVVFRANEGEAQSREMFASSLKDARIKAEAQFQKEFGWKFIIRSIEPAKIPQTSQTASSNQMAGGRRGVVSCASLAGDRR